MPYSAADLILCRSDECDGGWSLHAPGSTDDEIACGDAPPLLSGPSDCDPVTGRWLRPNAEDYLLAACQED